MTQIFINGLVAGSIWSLIALGFGLIYSNTRFFHFAHGAVFAIGPYLVFLFKVWLDLPLFSSIFISIASCALLGCLMELFIYRPLRHRGSSSLILLLASLSLFIILQNVISLVFGDEVKSIRPGLVEEGIEILGARITPFQITIICVGIVLTIAVGFLLMKTKLGIAMRAVADNPGLARISGIASDRVILWTFAIGSALAAVAGILVALDVDMTPAMGTNALMMGIVAVIIGGVGSIRGIVLGALFLGMAQHFGAWMVGSQWQDSIAFVILSVFLLFRPEGFMGKRIRKATV